MQKNLDFLELRHRQATTAVQYIRELHERRGIDEDIWRIVMHPRHIINIPENLRHLAMSGIRTHPVFNWETGCDGCSGWQWMDIFYTLCTDLGIDVNFQCSLGRGDNLMAFGCAAYSALCAYVGDLN